MLRAVPLALALLLIGLVLWGPGGDETAPLPAQTDTPTVGTGAPLQGRALQPAVDTAPAAPAEAAPPTRRSAPTAPPESRRLQVRVVRGARDGPPVEGVPIHRGETTRPLTDPPADQPLGFTDFEGRVTVEVPGGIELVHARPGPAYMPRALAWVTGRPDGATIILRPARTLRGRVLGVPTDKLRTLYMQARWTNPEDAHREATTIAWGRADKEGRFSVPVPTDALNVQLIALPAGAWRPEAHGLKSYAATFVAPADSGPFPLDFRKPVTVRGEVVGDDGTKITNGTVSFHALDRPQVLATDANLRDVGTNRFAVRGLAPGRYRVTAHAIQPGWASPVPRIVTLPLKGDLRIEMPPATHVRGRVTGVLDTKNVHVEWWHRAGPKARYEIQARTPLSAQATFALTNIADGDTLLRVIRGHTVLADLTHVRVPSDDVVVIVQKTKR